MSHFWENVITLSVWFLYVAVTIYDHEASSRESDSTGSQSTEVGLTKI